jgi:hypothetical protein
LPQSCDRGAFNRKHVLSEAFGHFKDTSSGPQTDGHLIAMSRDNTLRVVTCQVSNRPAMANAERNGETEAAREMSAGELLSRLVRPKLDFR